MNFLWVGREKFEGGRHRRYYSSGPFNNAEELKKMVDESFHNIEFISAEITNKIPNILAPIDPRSFQFGVLEKLERMERERRDANLAILDRKQYILRRG